MGLARRTREGEGSRGHRRKAAEDALRALQDAEGACKAAAAVTAAAASKLQEAESEVAKIEATAGDEPEPAGHQTGQAGPGSVSGSSARGPAGVDLQALNALLADKPQLVQHFWAMAQALVGAVPPHGGNGSFTQDYPDGGPRKRPCLEGESVIGDTSMSEIGYVDPDTARW